VIPIWKSDFPVDWAEDHLVTRREFTRSLAVVSCAAFATTGGLALVRGLGRKSDPPIRLVGDLRDLAVGGSKVFDYPEPGNPCLLVRIDAERVAAFGQRCTHLGCPVVFRPEGRKLYCPCHEGFFDAEDGRVLSGPPPRPLPQLRLELRGNEIWATGIRR
jgi:Rieske Fe-S protein